MTLGKTGKRGTVLFIALIVGALVLYLGFRASSPKSGNNRATSADKSQSKPSGDPHEAMVLSEALKKKPEHTPVLLRLAQLSEQAGNQPEAAVHLREILKNEPDNPEARLELGRVLFQMGDVQAAIEQTQAILDHQPDHADALFNLGAIHANLGNARLARQYWNELLRTSPQKEIAQRAKSMMTQLPSETPGAVETARTPARTGVNGQ
jgi:tetratricopeptide (TPR) repeat protein